MRPTIDLATGVAALGGFLVGYDTAVIAGAVGSLRDHVGTARDWIRSLSPGPTRSTCIPTIFAMKPVRDW